MMNRKKVYSENEWLKENYILIFFVGTKDPNGVC